MVREQEGEAMEGVDGAWFALKRLESSGKRVMSDARQRQLQSDQPVRNALQLARTNKNGSAEDKGSTQD